MAWPAQPSPQGPLWQPNRQPPVPVPPGPLPPSSDGLAWALVPLLTVGLGAPFSFAYAGLRRRSVALGVSAAAYGGVIVGGYEELSSHGAAAFMVGMLVLVLTWIVSTTHAFIVRPKVYPRLSVPERMNHQMIEVAKHRRALREAARKIVKDDPFLAHELRIGRPDLPRYFDDGGLIDVNHGPPATLALLPEMTAELIERVVRLRTDQGVFISVEELAVHADLPPDIVPAIGEYTVFIP